ncbi:hypothetical protein Bca52824_034269 [Brassica carinata]|uniref:Zinc knuckle CX2CX4HX4C domain-containing protein n=1 Tax=Brassica carinata TaxID=52824 RepID=A0A8X7V0M0_BRACI|nr:hypothetical protein Bca52824_034269 [Brassica carinata]
MEPTRDFASGKESTITLEYERLGNHCSYCFRLSHLQSQCPDKSCDFTKPQAEIQPSIAQRTVALADDHTTSQDFRGKSVARYTFPTKGKPSW